MTIAGVSLLLAALVALAWTAYEVETRHRAQSRRPARSRPGPPLGHPERLTSGPVDKRLARLADELWPAEAWREQLRGRR